MHRYFLFNPIYGYKREVYIKELAKFLGVRDQVLMDRKNKRIKLRGLEQYLIDETFTFEELKKLRLKEKLENEQWVKCRINPERYEISNYGRVISTINNKRELLTSKIDRGLVAISLTRFDGKRVNCRVAREVANHFIREVRENENVVHINDIEKNDMWNLKIVDRKNAYKYSLKKTNKPVIRIDVETGEREYYESIEIASKENYIDRSLISKVINGKLMLAAGYMWEKDEVLNFYV